jgi:hypothetical protein
MMNRGNLESFLMLGYFLDYERPGFRINVSGVNKERYSDATDVELLEIGCGLLQEAISANYNRNDDIVVPLSGGLDSRAILAGLLEHTHGERINTYTFGTPGTWDFDIGCEVAKSIGTKHHTFDLTRYVYRQQELEDISRRIDQQAILFHHWPVWSIDEEFGHAVHWSGFLGEALSGAHLAKRSAANVSRAIANFLERNRYVKSVEFDAIGPDIVELLTCEHVDPRRITIEEQLDLLNRQPKFIAPIVLMQGYAHRTPFMHQAWVDFILSVDNDRHRRDQQLYKQLLQRAFPGPFALRTKTDRGLPLNAQPYKRLTARFGGRWRRVLKRPSPSINYLDFDRMIRDKPDLREIVSMNVHDLDRRGILDRINGVSLLEDHVANRRNCADALIVLTSLEIHLKTGRTP